MQDDVLYRSNSERMVSKRLVYSMDFHQPCDFTGSNDLHIHFINDVHEDVFFRTADSRGMSSGCEFTVREGFDSWSNNVMKFFERGMLLVRRIKKMGRKKNIIGILANG